MRETNRFSLFIYQNEISAKPDQTVDVVWDLLCIPMTVVDGESNGLPKLIDMKRPPSADDPVEHSLHHRSPFWRVDPIKKSRVRFREISRKVSKKFLDSTVGLSTANFVELEFNPKKPDEEVSEDETIR